MDDSLEALLEKATNPKNKYEDWEFIMAFCDRVNLEQDGPQLALRMIVPKMRHENERVNLLALALLEACVKNCGQRFHQELGKFRFLNELIKMISEKYLGKQTPRVVKEKIMALLFSWKVGLPTEGKIAEAYEMLKKEGLVFDESQGPDATLIPEKQKPKVALSQDPKQAKMLQKLLASKNPDDLRAANRLIREMVRRDEKRMERMKRRLDELELIQNNVRLMNELLSHFRPESGEDERQLLKELYQSLEKMRPNMFRMASNLKPEEEGMDDILQTNDDLLRVMDTYKRVVGEAGTTSAAAQNGGGETQRSEEAPEEAGAAGGMGLGIGGGGDASTLIDLADLDFGSLPATSNAPVTSSNTDSLLDALGTLDFSTAGGAPATSQSNSLLDFPPILTNLAPASQPQAAPANSFPTFPTFYPSFPHMSGVTPSTTAAVPQIPGVPTPQQQPFVLPPPPSVQNPVLTGFGGAGQIRQQTPVLPTLGGQSSLPNNATPMTIPNNATPATVTSLGLLGDLNFNLNLGPQQTSTGGQILGVHQWGALQSDPLAVLADLTVPKDNIQPSTVPPIPVMNKNCISVSLCFTKNVPAPHVMVVVISAISTNALPVTQFQIQVAVPKVMRVKLQPPTGTELSPFNPMLPPANISQIMLLTNPTKDNIRLKYRISWMLEGAETIETGEVASFPKL